MMKRLATLCLGLGLITTMACVDGDVEDEPGGLEETGLNLVVNTQGDNDVVGMRYNIKKVSCTPKGANAPIKVVDNVEKALSELQLPGGIPTFENDPFADHSAHDFADLFTLLDAGCYDVYVQPLKKLGTYKKSGKPSDDCRAVSSYGVEVVDGQTTEIILVSQCDGPELGALDVIAALNNPPYLTDFEIYPDKFVECPEYGEDATVRLCARAIDPDGDPMTMKWKQLAGPDAGEPTVYHSVQVGDTLTECVEYDLPTVENGYDPVQNEVSNGEGEDFKFKAIVYDNFIDEYGDYITAEDWYEASDDYVDPIKSRGELSFPVYVSCVEPDEELKACPLPASYWETHNKFAPELPEQIEWPLPEYSKICGKTWVKNLQIEAGNDAFYTLSHELIAAKLNIANGAYAPPAVWAAIFIAKGITHKCPTLTHFSLVRITALAVAAVLKKFNKGYLTYGECEGLPEDIRDGEVERE